MFDLAADWQEREQRRERCKQRLVSRVTVALLLIGAGLHFIHWKYGVGPAGVGIGLQVVGSVMVVVEAIWDERRKTRRREPLPQSVRGGIPPAIPPAGSENPPVERFLAVLASYDEEDWHRLMTAARSNGLLDQSLTGDLSDTLSRQSASDGRVIEDLMVRVWNAKNRAEVCVEQYVANGLIPFAPPYEEYRFAFAGVLALLLMEDLNQAPESPLEVFAHETAYGVDAKAEAKRLSTAAVPNETGRRRAVWLWTAAVVLIFAPILFARWLHRMLEARLLRSGDGQIASYFIGSILMFLLTLGLCSYLAGNHSWKSIKAPRRDLIAIVSLVLFAAGFFAWNLMDYLRAVSAA